MKTLSVRQPWASLLVSGLKDIENRTWAPNYKGRILIHASSTKVPKDFADKNIFETNNEIENEQMFGNFPEFENLDYSAIVGYVTVSGDGNDSTSVWAFPVEHQWHIEDAYIFDEPIRNVKGKLNLFETPEIDEKNLPPAHKLVRRTPRLEGDCLIVPLTEDYLDHIIEMGQMNLGITEEISKLVEKPMEEQKDDKYAFKPISTVRLEAATRTKTFEVVQIGYQTWELDDGSQKKVISWNMEEMDYVDIAFILKVDDTNK
ncbi:MAG: ASCH domain-containing protein [Alloprevotella sp.]|nr:ASCH domain-containing protein [Bacteroidales bacterium]MDY3942619.1 ASCH domain-containing protein [Alloprevotella sp.]